MPTRRADNGRFRPRREDRALPTLDLGTPPAPPRAGHLAVERLEAILRAWADGGATQATLPEVLQGAITTPVVAAVWQSPVVRAWITQLHPDRAPTVGATRAWTATWCRWRTGPTGGAPDPARTAAFAAWLAAVLDAWDAADPIALTAFLGTPQTTVWISRVPHAGLPQSGAWARLCHGVWRTGDLGQLARELLAHAGTRDDAWATFVQQEPQAALRTVLDCLHEGRGNREMTAPQLYDRYWVALQASAQGRRPALGGPPGRPVRPVWGWPEVMDWWPVGDARYPRIAARIWRPAFTRDQVIGAIVRAPGWARWPVIGRLLRADWRTPRTRRVAEIRTLMTGILAGGADGLTDLQAYWRAVVRDEPRQALHVWRHAWPAAVPRDARWLAPLLEQSNPSLREAAVLELATTTSAADETPAPSPTPRDARPGTPRGLTR